MCMMPLPPALHRPSEAELWARAVADGADAEPPGASASRSVAPESAHDSGACVHEVPRVAAATELPDAAALLSCEQLCTMLANPEQFGLTPGVWVALDAPATLVASHAPHTLAGRLGVSPEAPRHLVPKVAPSSNTDLAVVEPAQAQGALHRDPLGSRVPPEYLGPSWAQHIIPVLRPISPGAHKQALDALAQQGTLYVRANSLAKRLQQYRKQTSSLLLSLTRMRDGELTR